MTHRSRAGDESSGSGVAPPPRAGSPSLRAALLLAAVLAVFYGPALGGGRFLYRDTGRMHVPVKEFMGAELREGRFPSWNPYYGLGMPIVGAAVDSPLHPLSLLPVVLPVHVAVTLWVLLAHLAAGLGMRAWLRGHGAGEGAALAAGLAFALTGHLVSSTDNLTYLVAIATVPWVFVAGDRWFARGSPAALAQLGLASFLCAAAGDPQGWGLAVIAAPVLALLLRSRGSPGRPTALRAALGVGVCLVAAAPVILPLLAWLPESTRTGALDATTRVRWNLAPIRLVELLVPGLLRDGYGVVVSELHLRLADPTSTMPWVTSVYLGITVAALAVAAAVRDVRARLLLGLAAVALWAALGHHAGFGQLAARLPVLQGFRYWEKLAFWPALLVTAAAALGIDRLLRDARLARGMAIGAGAVSGLAIVLTALAPSIAVAIVARASGGGGEELAAVLAENLRDGLLYSGALGLALAGAAWMLARGRLPAPAAVIAGIVALDLAGANVRAYQLDRAEVDRPRSALAEALAARPGLQRVLVPFDALRKRQGLTPSEAMNLYGALTLSSAWNVAYRVGTFDVYSGPIPRRYEEVNAPLSPNRLLPNVGLWSVGFVVIPGSVANAATPNVPKGAPVVAEDPAVPVFLFEVPHRPRAYLARGAEETDARGALAFALDPASAGGARSVIEAPVPAGAADGTGSAEIVRDEPTAVEVRVSADATALLVLNDLAAPGWRAEVDGRAAPIARANYLARGVFVPAGEHTVAFRYRTPGLGAGLLLAALGAAAIAGWAALRRRGGAHPT
jgi:hypothetical protein